MEQPNALTELETRLLSASLRQRLFQRPAEAVRFGRYRLLERLGQGGMGVVFSAYDDELDRRVAIKLLHAGRGAPGREQRARLRREAQALGRLSHPNVVQVYEIGETLEQTFVAMEFVRGVTLQAWLAERARGTDEIVEVFLQAGRGLAAAHAAGLVHRDFKPENALVGADGRVRVLDFGLARGHEVAPEPRPGGAPAPDLDAPLTATGALLGTPAYMAPEQIQAGDAPLDARADQFSFCVALYEALYGERPFAGANLERYVAAVEAGEVRAPTATRAVPSRLRQALLRGLRHRPDARWPDMDALLAALDPRPARARLRQLGLVLAVALGVLVMGAGVWAAVRSWQAYQREAVAQDRLATVEAQLADRLEPDEREAGERVIADFVALPEIRDTSAVPAVWARWAAMLAERGASSQAAWARAYALARGTGAREDGLLGLLRAFHSAHDATGVRNALALIAAEAPALMDTPELLERRFESAAHGRDLGAALALADAVDPGSSAAAVKPVLTAVAAMTPSDVPVFPTPGVRGGGSFRPLFRAGFGHPLPVPDWRDGPPLALAADGEALVLYQGGADALVELQRWPTPAVLTAVAAADLDGDGAQEIYLGLANQERGLRALRRDAHGTWQLERPAPTTDATRSDVDLLVSGDLDGDGRPELVAAVGVWWALDVRVLRRAASGELVVAARRKLGEAAGLGLLRSAAAPDRVVVAVHGFGEHQAIFPPGKPRGATPGFHVLRLDGDSLASERVIPVTSFSVGNKLAEFFAGDLDGDGLTDLAANVTWEGLLLARQRLDGSFAMVKLGGLHLTGGGQLDDDPAAELVLGSTEKQTWLAGVGDQRVAPAVLPDPAVTGHAKRLASAGAPTEVLALARAGLPGLVLATIASVGALVEAPVRRRMNLAAVDIANELGDDARARELLLDAADEPSLRDAALAQLVAQSLDLGRLDDAAAINAQRLASASLAADERARAELLRDRLAALATGRRSLPLHFSRADSPAWSQLDPSAVRLDPLARALQLHVFADRESIVAWPLRWSGERMLIELALTPAELDWSSNLTVRALDPDGAPAAGIALHVAGGRGGMSLYMTCHGATLEETRFVGFPDRDGAFGPLVLQLDLDVNSGALACRVFDGQRKLVVRARRAVPTTVRAGRYRLALGAEPARNLDVGARARVVLSRVEVAGAEFDDASPRQDLDRAAALLVDGETLAAEVAGRDDSRPGARLSHAVALARLGRVEEAASGFAAALRDAPDLEPELRRWLRSDPHALAPSLRRGLGERRFLELFTQAWTAVLQGRLTPEAIGVFIRELADLPASCHGMEERCVAMRVVLGQARGLLGDRARAREVLSAALRGDPPPTADQASQLHLELAYLAAAADERADAWSHVEHALATAPSPDIARDLVRAHPAMQPLRDTPEWRTVLGAEDGPP